MKSLILLLTFFAIGSLYAGALEYTEQVFQIGFEHFKRLNKPSRQEKNSESLNLSLDYKYDSSHFEGSFNFDLRFITGANDFNISLSEAFASFENSTNGNYFLGRRFLDWNTNETFWQLNHMNPSRSFRLMDRKQEGNIGAFFTQSYHSLTIQLFASYFYIPTLNPGINVEQGKIVTSSDWAKTPPSTVRIGAIDKEILYQLNKPSLKDVIFQKSLGINLSLELFDLSSLSGFLLYKPETNLRINAEGFLNTLDSNKATVIASPIINHHLLTGFQWLKKIESFQLKGGVTFIDPNATLGKDFDTITLKINKERKFFTTDFLKIEPKYDREVYTHWNLTYRSDFYQLGAHFLHYFTDHSNGNDDVYSDTTKWKTALGFSGVYFVNSDLLLKGSFRYDMKREDNLLELGFDYYPYSNFAIGMNAEFIKAPQDTSYWASYRTNDALFFNLRYFL